MFERSRRQAGIVAAGCLYALDYHIKRLQEDHNNATRLAQGLSEIEGVRVRSTTPETNMVFFDVSALRLDNGMFLALLQEYGVKMAAVGNYIRAATHLDVSQAGVEIAIQAVAKVAQQKPSNSEIAVKETVGY